MKKLNYWIPRGTIGGSAPETKYMREQWVSLTSGERMETAALGYLSDIVLPPPLLNIYISQITI